MKRALFVISSVLLTLSSWCYAAGNFTRIHESFTVLESIRPGLSEEGDVVAAASQALYVGNGVAPGVVEIDLSVGGYQLGGSNEAQAIHIRNGRELVFLAFKEDAACSDYAGVYRRLVSSSAVTTLLEGCRSGGSDAPRYFIDMSPNGTVVVPSVFGFVLVGNAAGPLNNPLAGTSIRYSTVGRIAVNDTGQIALQSETGGGRRIAFYSNPSDLTRYDVIATFSIANNPIIAINNTGAIIFSINDTFMATVGGVDTSFPPGVYLSEVVAGAPERRLTTIANNSGDFCHFGAVTINDAGHYAFSAQLASSGLSRCTAGSDMDGIFKGSNISEDTMIARGDIDLESHQFFDSVTLGYLNNRDELSFITSYSEPLVSPIFVWKASLGDEYRPSSLMMRFLSRLTEIWQQIMGWLNRFFT